MVPQEPEAIYGKRSIETDHNGARLRRDGCHFQYHCPLCGLAGPRAETAEEAKQGWRAASHQGHTVEQASAVKEPGLPTGEPLDERELRIIRILYNGKGCAACALDLPAVEGQPPVEGFRPGSNERDQGDQEEVRKLREALERRQAAG